MRGREIGDQAGRQRHEVAQRGTARRNSHATACAEPVGRGPSWPMTKAERPGVAVATLLCITIAAPTGDCSELTVAKDFVIFAPR